MTFSRDVADPGYSSERLDAVIILLADLFETSFPLKLTPFDAAAASASHIDIAAAAAHDAGASFTVKKLGSFFGFAE